MKTTKRNHLNLNSAIKSLLLLGFAAFFLFTIVTGTVSMYVHPRLIPYMLFAAAVMLIIAGLLLGELFKPTEKKENAWPLLFFIVPLMMAFALPAQSVNASTGAVGEVELAASNSTGDAAVNGAADEGLPLQNGILIMDGHNYYRCLNEIYADMDRYEGTKIELVGFVWNESEVFADNEFVPARLMMVCCAADMAPVGFLCRYEEASKLEADSWVKVSGTIGKTEYDGETIPYIDAQSVESTDKPEEDYIYPY